MMPVWCVQALNAHWRLFSSQGCVRSCRRWTLLEINCFVASKVRNIGMKEHSESLTWKTFATQLKLQTKPRSRSKWAASSTSAYSSKIPNKKRNTPDQIWLGNPNAQVILIHHNSWATQLMFEHNSENNDYDGYHIVDDDMWCATRKQSNQNAVCVSSWDGHLHSSRIWVFLYYRLRGHHEQNKLKDVVRLQETRRKITKQQWEDTSS